MKQRFWDGEVVRVAELDPSWRPDLRWVAGAEGTVDEYSGANVAGTGWAVSVWIKEQDSEERTLWVFDEDELETTGLVEDESGSRRPADPEAQHPEVGDAVHLRLDTDLRRRREALGVQRRVERQLADAVSGELNVELERHWHEPHRYSIRASLEPRGTGLDAVRRLLSSTASGWTTTIDDGWFYDLMWRREDADPGTTFLAPEIDYAFVALRPWSSPARRTST